MSIDHDVIDDIESSGVPTFKYETEGDTFDVVVISIRKRQQTEFGTGKPLTWDDVVIERRCPPTGRGGRWRQCSRPARPDCKSRVRAGGERTDPQIRTASLRGRSQDSF